MISSTFGGYMTAKLGLSAAQQGLYLTGQNLTNAGTEGYTRQRLDQVSINYGATYRYASRYNPNIGNGVLIKGTSQLRDPFLDLRYRNEVAHADEQAAKLDVLNDLRDILDEVKNAGEDSIGDGGIFNRLGDIIEKFKLYTSEIGSKEFDTMIKSSCQSLVTLFNAYSKRIDEVSDNLHYDLENADIPTVNKILESIQNLNKSIKNSEIIGQGALELKDERNLLIDQLSQYMKINVTYKPINVTESTVVDELHIALVGRDGQNYEIIADEQRREFTLSKDGDKTIVGMSALTPVDQELKAQLNTAQMLLNQAQTRYDNRNENFVKEYNNFGQANHTLYGPGGLYETLNGYQAQEPDALKNMNDLDKAYKDKLMEYDALPADQKTEEKLKEVTDAAAKREEAVNAYNTLKSNIRKAQVAVDAYKPIHAKAQQAYKEALADLDTDVKTPLQDEAGNPLLDKDGNQIVNDLLTGQPLQGGGEAKRRLAEAKENVTKALDALKQSEENGKAVENVNELFTDGKLKGELEMLNYSAEFDDPPNSIRGIGYYKSMLDTLANKFAEAMNEANNPYEFTVNKVDENGNPLYTNYDFDPDTKTYTFNGYFQFDGYKFVYAADDKDKKNPLDLDGNPIYQLDSKGNPIYDKDKNGQTIYINVVKKDGNLVYERNPDGSIKMEDRRDADGNLVYETDKTTGEIIMVEMKDEKGNPIKNPVYEDAKDKYGQPVLDVDGNPVRVLSYKMEDPAYTGTQETDNKNPSIYGMSAMGKDGNPIDNTIQNKITINGVDYTFVSKNATPTGNEFNDFKTLEAAAKKNGVILSQDADGKITGKTTAGVDISKSISTVKTVYEPNYDYTKDDGTPSKDDDGNDLRVVKYEVVKEPKRIQDPVPLKIPAPAKIAQTETQINNGTERHDLFKSKDGGKIVAGNIDLADGWVDNSYGITTALNKDDPSGNNTNVLHFINMLNGKLNYKADVNLMDGIKMDFDTTGPTSKEPSISGMKQGDTITIDGKVYTFTPGATGQTGNEFKDFDSLKIAAEKNGVALTQDANGKITAETLQKDLKYNVTVNGAPVGSLANINVDALGYGDTITIDGNTFTYKPAKYPDAMDGTPGGDYADPAKGEFYDLKSLEDAALQKNIQITTDGSTPPRITGIEKKAGEVVSDSISVDKEPGIGNMVTGNTITMGDDKTFTYINPDDVQAAIDNKSTFTIVAKQPDGTEKPVTFTFADDADGSDGQTFSDLASLIAAGEAATPQLHLFSCADGLKDAAAKEGYTIYVDPTTQQITTATKPGSNIFDGTFEEYYVSLDATLGMDIQATSEKLDNYSTLAGAIYDERESVTGVSHDEEAMNLMRYQQSYQAASRLMTTLDQVLDILLTQTGMVGR